MNRPGLAGQCPRVAATRLATPGTIGAALILPVIVALVAGNFPPEGRPRAYGLVMGAGAIAGAVGPLISAGR